MPSTPQHGEAGVFVPLFDPDTGDEQWITLYVPVLPTDTFTSIMPFVTEMVDDYINGITPPSPGYEEGLLPEIGSHGLEYFVFSWPEFD